MALRFAGLGSVVERPATKAATAQASLSAARRGARSDVAHIAPEVAAAYTLRMTRTRVVFRCGAAAAQNERFGFLHFFPSRMGAKKKL